MEKKKYRVTLLASVSGTVEVEAESAEKAADAAVSMYKKGKIGKEIMTNFLEEPESVIAVNEKDETDSCEYDM